MVRCSKQKSLPFYLVCGDCRKIIIESDSLVVVKKIFGTLSRNDPLYSALYQCQELIRLDRDFRLTHIYRETNFCADFLTSKAFNTDQLCGELELSPPNIMKLIEKDLIGVARPRATRL
ncbi:hypothetical protein REPUB_Repub04eG0060900 [Reevesia pubescens]